MPSWRWPSRRPSEQPNPLAPLSEVVEYLRAFLFGRLGWNRLGGNIIISGAFGLFQRDAVVNAWGYLHDTVGKDMELVLRLKRPRTSAAAPERSRSFPIRWRGPKCQSPQRCLGDSAIVGTAGWWALVENLGYRQMTVY